MKRLKNFEMIEQEEEKYRDYKKQFKNFTNKNTFILPENLTTKFEVSDYIVNEKPKEELKIRDLYINF